MWFATLSPADASPWLLPLSSRLLQNDRSTLSLMAGNPFPDRPPTWIRAQLYQYWFTTARERRETGNWWRRVFVRDYMRPISLNTPGLLEELGEQGWVK